MRWLTPTQVNTFCGEWGCPRKWFYRYKLKLKTKPSIHLLRGSMVHKVLEDFFKLDLDRSSEEYSTLRRNLLDHFDRVWQDHKPALTKLNLPPEDLAFYYEDSRKMIINFLHTHLRESIPLKPRTETKLFSKKHQAYAILDRIDPGPRPVVVDYKTGKSREMTEDLRLQLAMQALVFREHLGHLNFLIGVHYLKFKDGLKLFRPTERAIKYALDKMDYVRARTQSDDIKDYPCTCGGRCEREFILKNESERGKTDTATAQTPVFQW